jgi:hypothetical protein
MLWNTLESKKEMTTYLWQMYTLLPMAFWKSIGTTSPLQFFPLCWKHETWTLPSLSGLVTQRNMAKVMFVDFRGKVPRSHAALLMPLRTLILGKASHLVVHPTILWPPWCRNKGKKMCLWTAAISPSSTNAENSDSLNGILCSHEEERNVIIRW